MLQKDTTVTWMKDGDVIEVFPLKDEETNDVLSSKLYKFNKSFLVNNANSDNIGQYSCSVDNGIQKVLIQRHTLFPSLTNLSTETNHIFQNERLYLPCLVTVKYSQIRLYKAMYFIHMTQNVYMLHYRYQKQSVTISP